MASKWIILFRLCLVFIGLNPLSRKMADRYRHVELFKKIIAYLYKVYLAGYIVWLIPWITFHCQDISGLLLPTATLVFWRRGEGGFSQPQVRSRTCRFSFVAWSGISVWLSSLQNQTHSKKLPLSHSAFVTAMFAQELLPGAGFV